MTYAFVDQPPNRPVAPLTRAFLQFIYSDEAQHIIATHPGFLPLSKQVATKQQTALK